MLSAPSDFILCDFAYTVAAVAEPDGGHEPAIATNDDNRHTARQQRRHMTKTAGVATHNDGDDDSEGRCSHGPGQNTIMMMIVSNRPGGSRVRGIPLMLSNMRLLT